MAVRQFGNWTHISGSLISTINSNVCFWECVNRTWWLICRWWRLSLPLQGIDAGFRTKSICAICTLLKMKLLLLDFLCWKEFSWGLCGLELAALLQKYWPFCEGKSHLEENWQYDMSGGHSFLTSISLIINWTPIGQFLLLVISQMASISISLSVSYILEVDGLIE